jgi:ABC-type glycerol-3-phosphate transport system substrate-binding protein
MWFAWGLYAYGQGHPQFTMAMAPPPLAQAALDTDDVSTSSMYISARTDKQQACWTWLKYFSTSRVPGASNFPARRSAAQSDAMNQAQPGMAAVYQAYAAALHRAGQLTPGGDAPGTPPIDYYWFYRAIDQALQGKDLERELAEAQALTEQYVACVRAGGQRETCDQQVDPNYGQH